MQNSASPIIPQAPAHAKRGGVIQLHILFRMAFKNLFFKKLRTTLTILGVIIGIGAIVFLLAFGFGLQDLVSQQVIGSSSVQTIDVTSPKSKILELNADTRGHIKSLPDTSELGRSYSLAGKIKLNSSETETVIFATDRTYVDLSSLKFNSGKVFGDEDTGGILVNNSLVKALGINGADKAINQKILVTFQVTDTTGVRKTVSKNLRVYGVYQSDAQAEIFMNSRVVESEGMRNASQLKVVAKNKQAVSKLRKGIEALGFTTTSPLDTLDQINQVFTLLHYVLVGFGGIGMVIAILGMFNTLTISLLERTREIGLMISLGARKQDIKRLFIGEALMLSLLGGLFGVLGAIFVSTIGNIILNGYAHHNGITQNIKVFIISPELVGITLLLSAVVGLIVVYFPAQRASQINPIDALHFD